jgi:hypothetical protein
LKHLVDRLIEKNVLTRAEAKSIAPRLMSTSEPEPQAESE